MAAPFWNEIDPQTGLSLWDTITICGIRMGGLAKVIAHKGGKIDRKDEPGTDGAEFTHLGFEPTQIQISIRMWLPEHLQTWEELIKAVELRGPNGTAVRTLKGLGVKKPSALPVDVDHPALALHRVRSLYVAALEPPMPTGTAQVFEARIVGQEWKPHAKSAEDFTLTADASRSKITQQKGTYGATKVKPPPSQRATGPE